MIGSGRSERRYTVSSTRIDQLIADVQESFDRPPTDREAGLDVDDASLLQLRKACRLLTGADILHEAGYYTIVIEASFVAIGRSVEFRLMERGTMRPDSLPGSHPGVYREAAAAGLFSEATSADLADLWREHRAKTYSQDGLASRTRAENMHALATEIHQFIAGRFQQRHECVCDHSS